MCIPSLYFCFLLLFFCFYLSFSSSFNFGAINFFFFFLSLFICLFISLWMPFVRSLLNWFSVSIYDKFYKLKTVSVDRSFCFPRSCISIYLSPLELKTIRMSEDKNSFIIWTIFARIIESSIRGPLPLRYLIYLQAASI